MKFTKLEKLTETNEFSNFSNEYSNFSQSFRNSKSHQQHQQQQHHQHHQHQLEEQEQSPRLPQLPPVPALLHLPSQAVPAPLPPPPKQFNIQETFHYKNTENLEYESGIQIPEDEEVENILADSARQDRLKKTMPSKQIANDVLAVEELVHEIKENLRLKARPSHNHGRSSRPSPYHIPCRSWNDQNTNYAESNCFNKNDRYHHHRIKSDEKDIDDPYELLQALIKSNNLVKEAVRRLQLNSISPKRRSCFYESDEESRSPMFRMCQLEM